MKVKIGKEIIAVRMRGGMGYKGTDTLLTAKVECEVIKGEGRIEWLSIKDQSFVYKAPRRMWYTDLSIDPPEMLKATGMKVLINRYPQEIRADGTMTINWTKDHPVVTFRDANQ